MSLETQVCRTCLVELPISSFNKKKSNASGYNKQCRSCHNKYVKEVWYKKNAQSQKQASAKWKEQNKIRVLAARYGVSLEEIKLVLAQTSCRICGNETDLCIDHCHKTGKIRGRLCGRCNRAIGLFKDDIDLLRAAVLYLT